MKNIENKIIEFFNSRIERHILDYARDEQDIAVRYELKNNLRAKVIANPFSTLARIIRIELEIEQGRNDESVFPKWLEAEADRYANMREEKTKLSRRELIPDWTETELGLPEETIKLLTYLGAMVLTRGKPLWATKKFRKTARFKGMTIK